MATPITVDLGDVYPLAVSITDANGTAANAGSVTVTVTLPDGTTATPAVSNPSTGSYTADYPTVQAGRHTVRWVATGANASAYTDVFDVLESADVGLFSLAAAKAQLDITVNTYDEELRGFIRAVTRVVEGEVGAVVRRTCTVEVEGGRAAVVLPNAPVISVSSATPVLTGAPAVTLADLDVSSTGVVRHKSQLPISSGPVRFVYVAGRTVTPENFTLAGKIILQHMWETQRGGGRRPSLGGADEVEFASQTYSIPRRALELLKYEPVLGFA